MVVPPMFRSHEQSIKTYDYVDIASGIGYVTYYGGWTVDKTLLSNIAFYSADVLHEGGEAGGTFVTILDHDYDVEFRLPRTLKGTAIVNVPVGMHRETANVCHIRATAYIRKVPVVGAEEEIASNVGTDYALNAADARYVDAIDITIPETHFKAGETLRLTIVIDSHSTANGSGDWGFYGHDPYDRSQDENDTNDFSTYPSTLSALIPFKIDL